MLSIVLTVATLAAAAILYQTFGARSDRKRFPPPGRLIDAAGSKLHVRCTGVGGIPVLLEAGIAASSVSWTPVERELSRLTKVCTYDRAGLAWSPRSAYPRTPERILAELDAVAAQIEAPFILAGHSFGGLIARLYAARHPGKVAALVLVDPALLLEWAEPHQQRLAMLRRGVRLSRRGALLARFGVVRFALDLLARGARFLPKLIAKASSGKGAGVTERLAGEIRKLPPELYPVVQCHWRRPESFHSMADHLEVLPALAAAVQMESGISVPVAVISGAHLTPEQCAEHQAIAASSPDGRHIVAEGSGHWVHLDRPDLVVDAVRRFLNHG